MQRICRNPSCKQPFEVTEADLKFYDELSPVFAGGKFVIPPPAQCPTCRHMQRYVYRNEWNLYRRPCSKTGATIVSMYAPEEPFPVYDNPVWWGDDWDGRDFEQEVDFSRPFFEQFFALMNRVPKMARVQQGENVNSDYTNCASDNKNCYLLFSANTNEDCQYGTLINFCRDCTDNFHLDRCELCAHCINCVHCYGAVASENCSNCSDIAFCRNCIGCRRCFGCTNLHAKEYYFFNQPLTPEEYEDRTREMREGSFSVMEEMKKRAVALALTLPRRSYEGVQNENVTGNYVLHSRNAFECYDCDYLEDCKYCSRCLHMKDCQDISNYGATQLNELCYDCEGVGHGVFRVLFSKLIWGGSSEVLYSFECFASKHLFGCAGLKRAEHCILNRQYTPEAYDALARKLCAHMQRTGEWGKFLPQGSAPFGYNESVAQDYYPLSREEALARGFRWRERQEEIPHVERIIPAEQLPDCIGDVPDDVLEWAIQCKATKRPFLINKRELDFYRRMQLPLPRFHPDERHRQRMALLNPRRLWKRPCMKCGKEMETTYAPERPEIVYCENCYLKEVY
jgi:hypothetical protein